jgi:D-ribulokinase
LQKQTERINASHHPILQFCGGQISPEMQIPKLLWLKENRKEEVFDKAAYFFDLADWCTWKATGSEQRSVSSN